MYRLITSLALFSMVLVGPAVAEPLQEIRSESERNCIERSGGVTSAMLDCLALSYQTLDANLNRTWLELLPKLEPSQQQAFRDAQRRWIDFRDTTCSAEASLQAGSFTGITLADCRVRLTSERLRWLETVQLEK